MSLANEMPITFKYESAEDITMARIPATANPFKPEGNAKFIILEKAISGSIFGKTTNAEKPAIPTNNMNGKCMHAAINNVSVACVVFLDINIL